MKQLLTNFLTWVSIVHFVTAPVSAWSVSAGGRSRQLQLTVDNDAYFFTDYDRYYSSGIFVGYSFLQEKGSLPLFRNNRNVKFSADIRLSHYMYTPKNILWTSMDQLDRPYAGMITLGAQQNFLFKQSALLVAVDLGWLGPATGVGELQRWWHRQLNIRLPKGWEYQINNSPVVIVQSEYFRKLISGRHADLISITGLTAGTVFDKVYQGLSLRYGKPGSLNQSQFTNSLLGANEVTREWYVFASLQASRVLYNATIDGNLIGPASSYTEESAPWVLHQSAGFVWANNHFDFELSFQRNSIEVRGAESHRYMRAKISYRF